MAARVPPIYRSEAGELEAAALYDKTLQALPFPVERRLVPTQFGTAHVLVAGPEDATPLIMWQGAAMPGPFVLEANQAFVQKYRVHTADTPGQFGGRSELAAPNPDDHAWGRWCADVVRALGLDRGPLLHGGISFGGGLILDLAAVAPELISAAALVVPGALHPGWDSLAMRARLIVFFTLPMLASRLLPCAFTERLAMRWLFQDAGEGGALVDQLRLVLRHSAGWVPGPDPVAAQDLARLRAPVLVIAARDDLFGSGDGTAERARKVLPDCEAEVVASRHVPDAATSRAIERRILRFFSEKGFTGKEVAPEIAA